MANYGQAQAGGRNLDNVCGWPACSAGEAEAWWDQGRVWTSFTRGLVKTLTAKVPATEWPATLEPVLKSAAAAGEIFDKAEPWIAYDSEVESWAQAQQTLRDASGEIATFLESKGVLKAPKGPSNLPAQKGLLDSIFGGGTSTLLLLAAGGVAVYLLTRKRGKDKE